MGIFFPENFMVNIFCWEQKSGTFILPSQH